MNLLWEAVRAAGRAHPERLAVSDGDAEATYRELLELAEGVAGAMVAAGVRPGDRVGILATKSVRCVAAMLGAGMAGACYVPVDPRAPAPRSKYILENAGVALLVSERALARRLGLEAGSEGIPAAGRVLMLDDEPEDDDQGYLWWPGPGDGAFTPVPRNELDPAYMLYTSGSTGKPKGVVISHLNALTFVDWGRKTFELAPEDRLSSHAPFHFDLSVFDLYGAMTSGASVHLIPDRVAPFPTSLAAWIEETEITVWYSVPSALVRLLLHGDLGRFSFERLRTILFAGEVFPVKHLRGVMDAFAHTDFHNLYGPTETNVCTYYSVPRPLPDGDDDLPIGWTCENMEAFGLTDEGRVAEVGEEGELLVRGPCVMMGYWGLPERTAQSLIQNPLHELFRDPVYRTGDHVRVREDGGFEFLGRRDHMVKVRGYRVELGEIEQALHQHDGIREAAVVTLADDEVGATLHAAVVAEGPAGLDEDDVKRHCLERLPRYAVPETITVIDELPRTSTEKIDRVTLGEQLEAALAVG